MVPSRSVPDNREISERNDLLRGGVRVLVSDFNYNLPEGQIAQEPHGSALPASREDPVHVSESADLLQPEDLLVVNNTRVFPPPALRTAKRIKGSTDQSGEPGPP